MREARRLAAASTCIVLSACSGMGTAPAVTPPFNLAGTTWQSQAITPMDDSPPSVRPAPERPTRVHFGADGRASFQLDCNRGSGRWSAQPAPDGAGGSLQFGAIGVTRAMCPPPALDTRIARDLEAVRSYLVRDGILSMSLMADGGIYRWQRAPDASMAP